MTAPPTTFTCFPLLPQELQLLVVACAEEQDLAYRIEQVGGRLYTTEWRTADYLQQHEELKEVYEEGRHDCGSDVGSAEFTDDESGESVEGEEWEMRSVYSMEHEVDRDVLCWGGRSLQALSLASKELNAMCAPHIYRILRSYSVSLSNLEIFARDIVPRGSGSYRVLDHRTIFNVPGIPKREDQISAMILIPLISVLQNISTLILSSPFLPFESGGFSNAEYTLAKLLGPQISNLMLDVVNGDMNLYNISPADQITTWFPKLRRLSLLSGDHHLPTVGDWLADIPNLEYLSFGHDYTRSQRERAIHRFMLPEANSEPTPSRSLKTYFDFPSTNTHILPRHFPYLISSFSTTLVSLTIGTSTANHHSNTVDSWDAGVGLRLNEISVHLTQPFSALRDLKILGIETRTDEEIDRDHSPYLCCDNQDVYDNFDPQKLPFSYLHESFREGQLEPGALLRYGQDHVHLFYTLLNSFLFSPLRILHLQGTNLKRVLEMPAFTQFLAARSKTLRYLVVQSQKMAKSGEILELVERVCERYKIGFTFEGGQGHEDEEDSISEGSDSSLSEDDSDEDSDVESMETN